ncbi:MAG: NAD(P)-dependent oxidoreductase [Gammaproteobacteria bacterium]
MTNQLLSPESAVVGYVGLGIMGLPAARNLLKAGYQVCAWARRKESLTPFLQSGGNAKVAEDLPSLAAQCDAVITNVSDTPDVREVLLGGEDGGGIINGIKSGAIVIDMSTISPAETTKMAECFAAKGATMLDAPVSGGEKGAIDGTLTFMVGGGEDAFARAMPVFEAMGKTITRIGESGAGQTAKACNQIIIGATISGVAEAFALARASGANLSKIRAALLGGFAGSRVLELHGERMIKADYAPGFKAALHDKDIGLALSAASSSDIRLPSAELFAARLKRLIKNGGAEKDSSAIAEVLDEE